MTDDGMDAAIDLIVAAFDATEVTVVRAKCPRCRRMCIRSRYALGLPCYLCADTGEVYRVWDLLLMVEFGLSWNRYQTKLENDGPPWLALNKWITSRAKQDDYRRRMGGGRPRPDQG
jgi:hypothetical protein